VDGPEWIEHCASSGFPARDCAEEKVRRHGRRFET
jgi:hypothetical protein